MSLPALDVDWIKAKIDTGARTSALHAYDLEIIEKRDGSEWARFEIHPIQRDTDLTLSVEVEIDSWRSVKSSNGKTEERPVILTPITFLGATWDIELTLTNRDEMGYRMLLGRQGIRGRFAVDPNLSFAGGRGPEPEKKRVKKKAKKKVAKKLTKKR